MNLATTQYISGRTTAMGMNLLLIHDHQKPNVRTLHYAVLTQLRLHMGFDMLR